MLARGIITCKTFIVITCDSISTPKLLHVLSFIIVNTIEMITMSEMGEIKN